MNDVLAVAEHREGSLRDVSLELITAGAALAGETGGRLLVAVIADESGEIATAINRTGVDRIVTIEAGDGYNHGIYVQALTRIVADLDPRYLLMAHTATGMDYAPAVAARVGCPLMTDAVGLAHDDDLSVTREFYGGKVEGTVRSEADRVAITLRPGEWAPAEMADGGSITPFDVTIEETAVGSTVTGYEEIPGGDVDIAEADFLVAIGRGIEEENNLPLIEELVDALDATLAASRPIVDNGWLPKHRQVGQSGKTVAPDVYIAIGISGATQHLTGMKDSETIIAINEDPDAPIFDVADYGIVDDLFAVVPALIERFA